MKKIISLVSIFAILVSIFAIPVSVSATYDASINPYTVVGDPVVDNDTASNEVIFGDNFNRGPGAKIGSNGWDINLIAATATNPVASSAHGLAWSYGSKPASTVTYTGTWGFAAKDETAEVKDYYLEIATGSNSGTKTAEHIIKMPVGDLTSGNDTENPQVYVMEFDALIGDALTFNVQANKADMYVDANLAFLTLCDTTKSYVKRYDPDKWHHYVIVIDEINNAWCAYIDNEFANGNDAYSYGFDNIKSGANYIRFMIDMPANGKCGIDNVYFRKAGNRALVFDSQVYSFTDGDEPNYTNKATAAMKSDTTIASDATGIIVTKCIINESSVPKNSKVIIALYDNDNSLMQIYVDEDMTSVAAYTDYHRERGFDEMASKVKVFVWNDMNSITPIVLCDEFTRAPSVN